MSPVNVSEDGSSLLTLKPRSREILLQYNLLCTVWIPLESYTRNIEVVTKRTSSVMNLMLCVRCVSKIPGLKDEVTIQKSDHRAEVYI